VTGGRAEFGRIAAGLGERHPETGFQVGLRKFSYLLLWVALTLTAFILVVNILLGRPLIQSMLFALAIAVLYHAAAAARRGQHQPGDGIAAVGEAEGPRQTPGVHRGPR
jgi:hypothetical protein